MADLSDTTLDDVVETFELLDNWEERFEYLMDLGRKLPPLEDSEKVEENRVHGCQSTVWLKERVLDTQPATIEMRADSNAFIVKGLIALLVLMYSGRTPRDILATDPSPTFEKLGLDRHLSPTRRNGLFAMVERIRALAAQVESGSGS